MLLLLLFSLWSGPDINVVVMLGVKFLEELEWLLDCGHGTQRNQWRMLTSLTVWNCSQRYGKYISWISWNLVVCLRAILSLLFGSLCFCWIVNRTCLSGLFAAQEVETSEKQLGCRYLWVWWGANRIFLTKTCLWSCGQACCGGGYSSVHWCVRMQEQVVSVSMVEI